MDIPRIFRASAATKMSSVDQRCISIISGKKLLFFRAFRLMRMILISVISVKVLFLVACYVALRPPR
jgi:hypothetical protein